MGEYLTFMLRTAQLPALPSQSLAEVVGAVVCSQLPGFVKRLHYRWKQWALLAVVQILLQLLHVGHPNDHCVSKRTL